jgi:uncharacterized membrane protein YfcA
VTIDVGALVTVLVAMTIGSFIKGATGQGLPQIAIPVIASFIGVEHAVVVMAIPGVVSNFWLLWSNRDIRGRSRDLPLLLTTGIVGAVTGTIMLKHLDERVLALAVAAAVLVYALVFLFRPRLELKPEITRIASGPVGLAAGALQGATGMSGPIVSTYLHGYRLEKRAYVFTLTTVFQVYALVQSLTFLFIGLYDSQRLLQSGLALVPIMAALPLGAAVAQRLSQRAFDVIVLAIPALSALKLVYDAFS